MDDGAAPAAEHDVNNNDHDERGIDNDHAADDERSDHHEADHHDAHVEHDDAHVEHEATDVDDQASEGASAPQHLDDLTADIEAPHVRSADHRRRVT
jgi:hypothetical protein